MQPRRGLALGRPFGSALILPVAWLPAAAAIAAHLAVSVFTDRALLTALGLGFVCSGLLLVAVVVHELAHIVIARLVGARRGETRVWIFGGVPAAPSPTTPARGTMVAFAGPAASGLVALGLHIGAGRLDGAASDVLSTGALLALGVSVVNLLPVTPFDGGRALVGWLARTRGRARAERLGSRAGRLVGALLVLAGACVIALRPTEAADAAFGMWLALTGLFAIVEGGPARAGSIDATAPVSAWTRPFVGRLEATDLLPDATGPYAVSEDGRLTGIVVGRMANPDGRTAADVMVPWLDRFAVRADEPAVPALERLARGEVPVLVVLDGDGVVRGVVDPDGIREHLVS